MSRIVLVAPPWYRLMNWHARETPLGLCSLAAYMNGQGHQACVLNQDFVADAPTGEYEQKRMFDVYDEYQRLMSDRDAPIWRDAIAELEELQPEVVGMTAQVGSFASREKAKKRLRNWSRSWLAAVTSAA